MHVLINMDTIFKIDSNLEFEKTAEEILNSLYVRESTSANFIEQNVFKAAKDDLKNIVMNTNFNTTELTRILEEKKIGEDKIRIFISLIENKKMVLLCAALTYYNSSYGEIVTDNDWLLKLVFGTSELKTLRYSLLQLIFTTMDNKGAQKCVFDLNKDILIKMINALQTICEN